MGNMRLSSNSLRTMRSERGYTQADIARVLDISREAYSLYESGKRRLNPASLCLLADFYGASVDCLLGRRDVGTVPIPKDEAEIVRKYRLLDERGKESVRNVIDWEYAFTATAKAAKAT